MQVLNLISKGTYSSKSRLSPFWIVVCHFDTKQFSFTWSDFLLISFSIVSALIDPFIWAWSSWKLITLSRQCKDRKRPLREKNFFFALFEISNNTTEKTYNFRNFFEEIEGYSVLSKFPCSVSHDGKYSLAFTRADWSFKLTIRPAARKGYGSIAHDAKPNGLLTRGPWGRRV